MEMGSDLLDNDRPFVIFTPFRAAIPYIQEAISNNIKNVKVYSVTGGLTAEEFSEQWQGFQNDTTKRKILLCVIKSGASFHATCASTAFFLGYEWDFNQNAQSEDRLCRFGQKDFVNIYYMMHKDTIDEDVAQRLNEKQEANDWVIGNEEQYEILRRRYKMSTNL
jgi:SNF2 family DNA or RNA helicase